MDTQSPCFGKNARYANLDIYCHYNKRTKTPLAKYEITAYNYRYTQLLKFAKGGMMNAIIKTDLPALAFVKPDDSKNVRNRLERYQAWTQVQGIDWREKPTLTDYRDYLTSTGLSPVSINSHLSTIRGRFADVLKESEYRDYLYSLFAQQARGTPSLADRKAFVDEIITRMYAAINPKHSSVEIVTKQDESDSEIGIRITSAQASDLLQLPNVKTRQGLRDLALLAFALCTGLREAELADLNVEDLRRRLKTELAVQVLNGKGKVQRLVPYGSLSWCLAIVDTWMQSAGITEGAVFRSFRKGDKVSTRRLSIRAIEDIVKRYCIYIQGDCVTLAPHDLRRSYASICYFELSMDIVSIQRNLAHKDHKTTLRYIGAGDESSRAPKRNPFVFDTSVLRIPV